jgi:hypothetical protein
MCRSLKNQRKKDLSSFNKAPCRTSKAYKAVEAAVAKRAARNLVHDTKAKALYEAYLVAKEREGFLGGVSEFRTYCEFTNDGGWR